LEDAEGPTEKEELKFVSGVKNGLSPSKLVCCTARLESGFGEGFIGGELNVSGSRDFELLQAK
jgi:hypothetical protein